MEEHALKLIDLYMDLNTKQEELGSNIERAMGLSEGDGVGPTILDESIGKLESVILDMLHVSGKERSHMWDNGLLYRFCVKHSHDSESVLEEIKKVI
ncbi:hypothetical protein QTG56_25840 (plasmid) [Rossellomorea sp. AcN35-11]|nr:hypothetical protein [Rossellomorea aquimaris]WJV32039.1 hypothetical protein QTG56_25840 [Rossellomorea sp. AcN35-11]